MPLYRWPGPQIASSPIPNRTLHLKKLFPQAVAFSPLEGTPLHFKAYAPTRRQSPDAPALGYAFWSTDIMPQSGAITPPSTSSSAWTSRASSLAWCSTTTPSRTAISRFSRPSSSPVQGQEHPRSVSHRPGHRRGVAGFDHHGSGRARDSREFAHDGPPVPQPSLGEEAVMFQPEPDPWGFEEAPVPTFAEILQPQIPDLLRSSPFSPSPITASAGRACR